MMWKPNIAYTKLNDNDSIDVQIYLYPNGTV